MGKIEIDEERLLQIIEYGEKMAALARQALAVSKNKFHIYAEEEKAIQGPDQQFENRTPSDMRYEFGSHGSVRIPKEISGMMDEKQQLQPGEIPEGELENVRAGVKRTPEELAAMMEESHQQLQPGEIPEDKLGDVHAGYPKPYTLTNDGNNPYR